MPRIIATLFLAFLLLTLSAHLRPPEYDEAYSIFLTAGDPRPAWPQGIFHPNDVRNIYDPKATPRKIAHDLRIDDVHPPLYFWALEYWRRLIGPSWFAARMLSVLFSVAALTALAWLATLAEIPVFPTLFIALLSYGFAYTGIVARGFALAQLLNTLGLALAFLGSRNRKWPCCLLAGIAFGAAAFTNYLAIFIALATLAWLGSDRTKRSMTLPTAFGLTLFLPAIAYFFIAQRSSRIGQFVPFTPAHAVALLAKDSGASVFGGLPLYAGNASAFVAAALAATIAISIGFIIKNWKSKLFPFALAAIAMPAGLLALGFIFNNTPIEIRYLAFSIPSLALLLAHSLPRAWLYLMLGIEACGFAGLAVAPATMQPQGLAARQLDKFATSGSLILLPFGNDGVGIPGPFIASAPGNLRLELLRAGKRPDINGEHDIILVTIYPDTASAQSTANALAMFHANHCFAENASTTFLKFFTQTGCNP